MTKIPLEIQEKIYGIDTLSIPYHILKPKLKPKPKPKPVCSSTMSEEDFNTFWELYPRHESKSKAKDKFLKLDKCLLPTILEALKVQSQLPQWKKDKGQFVPHPTTWLNGCRWEDEVEEKQLDVSERRILN